MQILPLSSNSPETERAAPTENVCPLCWSTQVRPSFRDNQRSYRSCDGCRLIFVPPKYFLTPQAEKARYDEHQNSPEDQRYRQFLGHLFHPLTKKLPAGACGLDFGCGPGPTLSVMFDEAGYSTAVYDPFYAPDESIWQRTFDFISASEVVEHLHTPRADLDRLWAILKPGGWLGIMTKRTEHQSDFATWHYKNDPTHVAFFAEDTFRWLANRWSALLEVVDKDVVLLQKVPLPLIS